MAVGSKDLTAEQLRTFESERLVEELRKAKEELFNLRFQSATGQLESHGRLRAVTPRHRPHLHDHARARAGDRRPGESSSAAALRARPRVMPSE